MTPLREAAPALILLFAFTLVGLANVEPATHAANQVTAPSIPVTTDDGLDPINLVFTGFSPSWWVSANMMGWSDSEYCSGPKTVDGSPYNYTLEHPDSTGVPCWGPRDHIRIWDMGYSPAFGEWAVASAHHEHTVCNPLCHHVIDSWSRPEADALSAFLGGPATVSISNYTLANAGDYQGVFFNGNATLIQLNQPAGHYPVVFSETGLGNETSWSVTLNGVKTSSVRPAIVFDEPDGTYDFTIDAPNLFIASPNSGTVTIDGAWQIQHVQFQSSNSTVSFWGYVTGAGFAAGILGIAFLVFKMKRREKMRIGARDSVRTE